MLQRMWERLIDEVNIRVQSLKSNSSTALMVVRSSVGVSGIAMLIRSEGFEFKVVSKPFGLAGSVSSYASTVRKEVASALKKMGGNAGGGSMGGTTGGGSMNGNRGRPRKRGRNIKTETRVKGVCYKFNDNEGCDRQDCRFKHVCEICGKGDHPKTACTEEEA